MLAILALLSTALCATLRGQINDLQSLDIVSTSLVLRDIETTHRERYPVASNGTFELYNLEAEKKYLLSLDSDTIELPYSYLVVPKVDDEQEFDVHKVTDGRPLDTLGPSVKHPIIISGAKRTDLVVERPNFSIIKFISQPMVLLSLGALLLVTYLPKLIDGLDPEVLEELQKNQIQSGQTADKVQNFDLAKSIAERRAKK